MDILVKCFVKKEGKKERKKRGDMSCGGVDRFPPNKLVWWGVWGFFGPYDPFKIIYQQDNYYFDLFICYLKNNDITSFF